MYRKNKAMLGIAIFGAVMMFANIVAAVKNIQSGGLSGLAIAALCVVASLAAGVIAFRSLGRYLGWVEICALLCCSPLQAATRTANFIVSAEPGYEATLAGAAERFRRELAIEWLGRELPQWDSPCPIRADIQLNLDNGGATSFVFDRGQVFGFEMSIQGDPQNIVESVLKHEVLHTVFATHFLQRLPRWADEGACSTVESRQGRHGRQRDLVRYLQTNRGIGFGELFGMREYPQDILPLYAHGHSLVTFLLEHGGKRYFVDFLAAGLRDQDWPGAVAEWYGYRSLDELQACWLDWVKTGSQLVPGEIRLRAPDT